MSRDPYQEIHAIQPEEWRQHAACRGFPTAWWYPEKGETTRKAQVICSSCPVRDECCHSALQRSEEGVWGGMNIRERRRLRIEYDVQKVLVCQHCRGTFEKPATRHVVSMYCSEACRKGRQNALTVQAERLRRDAS